MVFRVLLIILNTVVTTLIFTKMDLIITPYVFSFVLIVQIIEIIKKGYREQDNIIAFLETAVMEESLKISSIKTNSFFSRIQTVLENINVRSRNNSLQKQKTEGLLEALLNHINIGLISFDSTGDIELLNKKARNLFGINYLTNIRDLDKLYENDINNILNFEYPIKSNIILKNEKSLYFESSNLVLEQSSIRIISIQNIDNALDKKELDSWNVLIRTLNHELMNSITPISSLAATALSLLDKNHDKDLVEAIQVIGKRSQNLLNFVENYRKLSQVPTPQKKLIKIGDLFDKISVLMEPYVNDFNSKLSFSISDKDLLLWADDAQLEQIIINLVKNSIEADATLINLNANLEVNGSTIIILSDNGSGFTKESKSEAIVPFYTTKPGGSGLGLSIVRQIMNAHGGNLIIENNNKGAVVTLKFN